MHMSPTGYVRNRRHWNSPKSDLGRMLLALPVG